MNRKNRSLFGYMALSFFCLLAFQNCDSGFEVLNSPSGDGLQKFKAGDVFKKELIPYEPQGQLIADINAYSDQTGFKAIAMAQNGMGIGVANSNFANQDEANRVILEQCQILADNQPCVLLVEGNKFKVSEKDLVDKHVSVLETGIRSFNADKVPMVLAANRIVSGYANYCTVQNPCSGKTFKALAIGHYGKAFRANGDSQIEANRRALQGCEVIDQKPCTLYAEGLSVVFNVNSYNWNKVSQVPYKGASVVNHQWPFVNSNSQNSIKNRLQNTTASGERWAIAISRFGHYWITSSTTDSISDLRGQAASLCNTSIGVSSLNEYECMSYASSETATQVDLTLSEVQARNRLNNVWAPNIARAFSNEFTPPQNTLRGKANEKNLSIGTAAQTTYMFNPSYPKYSQILKEEFNLLVPENEFMMNQIQATQGQFNFQKADALVAYAIKHKMSFRGHPLVWHMYNPSWLMLGSFSDTQLKDLMETHIKTIVSRYHQMYPNEKFEWVVVNEAIADSAGHPLRAKGTGDNQSIWANIGSNTEEYIRLAFHAAHEADPTARLFYNDYQNEISGNSGKGDATFNLVKRLKESGVPIHGVGLQAHTGLGNPTNPIATRAQLMTTIERYKTLGLEVSISEFDMSLLLNGANPTTAQLQQQETVYSDYISACVASENCTSFVTWGFTDHVSWIPKHFPGFGSAHIWDKNYNPKPHIYPKLLESLE